MNDNTPINRFRAQRTKAVPATMEFVREGEARFRRGATTTKIGLSGRMLQLATSTWISQEFLDGLEAQRNLEQKAPRGDSHGAFQKIAEIPLAYFFSRVPPDALGDEKAITKLLNEPDLRAFRCDGHHRRA